MMTDYSNELPNNAVNADAFSARWARYKCAGYGWRWQEEIHAISVFFLFALEEAP